MVLYLSQQKVTPSALSLFLPGKIILIAATRTKKETKKIPFIR